jgi:hypothetical protein
LNPMIHRSKLIVCDVCLQDAVIWLWNSPDKSLAFILADSGFDVWIVSGRGTRYSSHISLTPNDKVLILNDEFGIPYRLGFSALINSNDWRTINQD